MKHILLTLKAATNLADQDSSVSKEACALQAKLLQTQIWVMICLNQEGLRSPSASKYINCVGADWHCSKTFLNKLPNRETYFAHLLI